MAGDGRAGAATAAPEMQTATEPAREVVLEVDRLVLRAERDGATSYPVTDVSLSIGRGEALGIVGESGSGKTLTLRAIIGLLPRGVTQVTGAIRFQVDGRTTNDPSELRGRGLAMIFQEPMTTLNPTMRVGDIVAAGARRHRGLSRREGRRLALDLLDEVGIPNAADRLRSFPHELSGGLRQRVMIASALATEPAILLCDEPTTALDATIQDQILSLLARIRDTRGLSLVFVSHDLGVIGRICDQVTVMYAGQVIEAGSIDRVFSRPSHPYTLGLLASLPELSAPGERLRGIAGQPPEPSSFPDGCRFAPRCDYAEERCWTHAYDCVDVAPAQRSACCRVAVLPLPGRHAR